MKQIITLFWVVCVIVTTVFNLLIYISIQQINTKFEKLIEIETPEYINVIPDKVLLGEK